MITRSKTRGIREDCYRRADVLDRWANIYGGKTAYADFARFDAARLRLVGELYASLEPVAAWLAQRLPARWSA